MSISVLLTHIQQGYHFHLFQMDPLLVSNLLEQSVPISSAMPSIPYKVNVKRKTTKMVSLLVG